MIDDNQIARVAYVSAVGATGGGERVLMELARGAAGRGWSPAIFCLRDGAWSQGAWGDDIKITALRSGYRIRYPWTVVRAAHWLRDRLREFRPSVIHANHASWWIAAWAARGLGASTIWHLHDFPDHQDLPTRIGVRFPPTATLFTTAHVASGYPRLNQRQHAVIAPVTIDVNSFRAAGKDASVLQQYGLDEQRFFLTVSRWQHHKGLHDLVTAAADSVRREPPPHGDRKYVIVGRPSNAAEQRYRGTVLQRMVDLEVERHFVLIPECSDEQLRSLYTSAAALIHPALSEGFGLVLLEAMSLGLPVIACDAAGPAEILSVDGSGVLVPRGCPLRISEAMQSLLSDSAARKRISDAGTLRASQLSREQMVNQTFSLYEKLLEPASHRLTGNHPSLNQSSPLEASA
jgi:glycosyltransferase involved in cell wall biosynthesis